MSFQVIVKSILHLFKESVEYNLDEVLPQFNLPPVTGSAFTQARYKIHSDFFQYMERIVVKHYLQIKKRLWKGHRLIGVDGSTLNLPPTKDIIEHFGIRAQNNMGIKRSIARVSFFYDLLNDFVVENELTPTKEGEKVHFLKGLNRIDDLNDIYILDRGYGHYNTVLELINRKKLFCIRFPSCSNFISSILSNKKKDMIIEWSPSNKEKENCKKQGLIPKTIKVRVTKIVLKTGEIEVLISNLMNTSKYSHGDLKWIYNKRWVVEEGFKKLKPKMKVEYFGARKTAGVYQEYYAHVFIMNIIAFFTMICDKKLEQKLKSRKYKYKSNWQNAYRITRTSLIQILSIRFDEYKLETLITRISYSTIPIIPNKSSPRDMRHANKKGRISHYYK